MWNRALLLTLAMSACTTPRTDDPGGDVDGGVPDAMPDAAADPCEAMDPRSVSPEVFVGPTGLATRLAALMDAAKSSIDLSMYILSAEPLVDALVAAAERGVTVRVVVDALRTNDAAVIAALEGAGVEVHNPADTFSHYHAKTMILDGETAVVTSANFNDYSIYSERNHGVVLEDPADVADLLAIFEADFSGGEVPECTRLVVSPTNSRARLEAFIKSAKTSLDLQQLGISDERIHAAIAGRVESGVTVRVMLADPAWIESNVEDAETLRAAGAEVRFFTELENHAKLIVVDDEAAFVGSENLSWTSLEMNREIGILTAESPAIDTLATAFETDWSSAVE